MLKLLIKSCLCSPLLQALLEINPFIACAIIGVTTFLFSWVGVFVGTKSGVWLKSKAELLGGVILIVIGLRILLF